jgi:hypothetical protein
MSDALPLCRRSDHDRRTQAAQSTLAVSIGARITATLLV